MSSELAPASGLSAQNSAWSACFRATRIRPTRASRDLNKVWQLVARWRPSCVDATAEEISGGEATALTAASRWRSVDQDNRPKTLKGCRLSQLRSREQAVSALR